MTRRAKPEKAANTFRRYCEGESVEAIAASLGLAVSGLYRLWNTHGLTWRRSRRR